MWWVDISTRFLAFIIWKFPPCKNSMPDARCDLSMSVWLRPLYMVKVYFDSYTTSQHGEMLFGCRVCPFNADLMDDVRAHARVQHSYNLDGVADPSAIIAAISLPRDLRALRCRLCRDFGKATPRVFLAQDRAVLCSHVRRAHSIKIDVVELKYFCRLCAQEFAHTEAFLKHSCCDLNGQNKLLDVYEDANSWAFHQGVAIHVLAVRFTSRWNVCVSVLRRASATLLSSEPPWAALQARFPMFLLREILPIFGRNGPSPWAPACCRCRKLLRLCACLRAASGGE